MGLRSHLGANHGAHMMSMGVGMMIGLDCEALLVRGLEEPKGVSADET